MTDTAQGDLRGEFAKIPLATLLQRLAAGQRTGVLAVATPAGPGELRIVSGEIFDAVYRRLDGEKALFRLLQEPEGCFAFTPGGAPALRRLTTCLSTLLIQAPLQAAEVLRIKSLLSTSGDDAIITTSSSTSSTPIPPSSPAPALPSRSRPSSHPPSHSPFHSSASSASSSPASLFDAASASCAQPFAAASSPAHPSLAPPPSAARAPALPRHTAYPSRPSAVESDPFSETDSKLDGLLLQHLQVPHSLEEVLDDFRPSDLHLLRAIQRLLQSGKLRRVPRASLMTRLAPDERLGHLRALVTRLVRDGFAGVPRVFVAAIPERLTALAGAILRVDETSAPSDPPPPLPVPYPLATLRFGESVELSVVGLPLVDTLLPSWSMFLPGTGAVVTLDTEHSTALTAACALAEIPLLHADALLGEVDEADPAQVAALLRTTLETAAGA